VLVEAQDLALELGSPFLDAGHILYGCAEGREETAGRPLRDCGITGASLRHRLPRAPGAGPVPLDPDALRAIGIDYDGVLAAVEGTFGPGALEGAPDRRVSPTRRKPRFTPEAKRALELSLRATLELHHQAITPGHLLLGLLRLDDEFINNAVTASGTNLAALSGAVLSRLTAVA
jgi:hypothetical protein